MDRTSMIQVTTDFNAGWVAARNEANVAQLDALRGQADNIDSMAKKCFGRSTAQNK
ncbi:Lipoprotein [Caenorhabditis elegans]|nr:Lipoprotein [Caenorhabditis elegans]CDH93041.1 Lipoprotein [Caenorhabditis elegans]|eukprot:NP_001294331.1 Uncharacterized protein CELE_K08F11.1 [Caenorhabditis elegans]